MYFVTFQRRIFHRIRLQINWHVSSTSLLFRSLLLYIHCSVHLTSLAHHVSYRSNLNLTVNVSVKPVVLKFESVYHKYWSASIWLNTRVNVLCSIFLTAPMELCGGHLKEYSSNSGLHFQKGGGGLARRMIKIKAAQAEILWPEPCISHNANQ